MDLQQDAPCEPGLLSRGELELELAALALAVTRSARERSRRPRSAELLLATTVDAFLAAALRLLERTRRAHRSWLVGRLTEIAASAELGIIGFDEWLVSQEPAWRRTSDRWPAASQASEATTG